MYMTNKEKWFSLATSYITKILFPQMSTLANVMVFVLQHILGRLPLLKAASVCKFKKQIQVEKLSHIF